MDTLAAVAQVGASASQRGPQCVLCSLIQCRAVRMAYDCHVRCAPTLFIVQCQRWKSTSLLP